MTAEESEELISQEVRARVLRGDWSGTTYALAEAKAALGKAIPIEALEERGKLLCPRCRRPWLGELFCPDCGQALNTE